MKFSQVTGFATDEVAAWAKKHLVQHSVIASDGLNCFSGLEKAGFSHQAIISCGGPDSVKRPEFKWVNTMIGNVKNSIRGTYHAVSEKHVPRYLTEFCYRFNRRFQLGEMVDRIVYASLCTSPIPLHQLKLVEVRW